MFRNLLVDNPLRFLISPSLGALGGLVAWVLFTSLMTLFTGEDAASFGSVDPLLVQRSLYFAFTGLCIGFACNMLRVIQDGQGPMRVFGVGLLSGVIAAISGLLGGLGLHLILETKAPDESAALLPHAGSYVIGGLLVIGLLVGLSSRFTTLDRHTVFGAFGGLLGSGLAVGVWLGIERWGADYQSYSYFLIPMSLGFGIGLLTYSLPNFILGGSFRVLTGQHKGQKKDIEGRDIVIGNNKRELQWVLPKWEGVQDPHARIEVAREGRGYLHFIRNLSTKAVVVLRDGKRNRIRGETVFQLEDGDVVVLATGKSYVKMRYSQNTGER